MDLAKLMDRSTRHGQIGSLNDRMEKVLGTDKTAAIFEFRELAQAIGDKIGDTMESYENKLRQSAAFTSERNSTEIARARKRSQIILLASWSQ